MLEIKEIENYLSGDVVINMKSVYSQLEMSEHCLAQSKSRDDIFDLSDIAYWTQQTEFWKRFIEECEARNVIMRGV